MALDERSRHELYLRLEQALGPEAATTMMEMLPPVGWADVATKHDLDIIRAEMRANTAEIVATLRAEMNAQLRSIYTVMIGTMLGTATLAGTLAFTAARLG